MPLSRQKRPQCGAETGPRFNETGYIVVEHSGKAYRILDGIKTLITGTGTDTALFWLTRAGNTVSFNDTAF
jgi:hypothetical protein